MPPPPSSAGPLRTFARLLGLSAAVLVILLTGVMLMMNPYDTGGIVILVSNYSIVQVMETRHNTNSWVSVE